MSLLRASRGSERVILWSLGGLILLLPLFDGGRSLGARTFLVTFVSALFLVGLFLGSLNLHLRAFFLLILFLLISFLRSAYADLSIQASLLLLTYFLVFALASTILSERGRVILVYSLVGSALCAAIVAFAMYLLARPGSAEALALTGTFHYTNGLAGFLLLGIYPCFALFLHTDGRKSWIFGLISVVLLIVLSLTRSRGGWLAFLLAFLFWVFEERNLLIRKWGRVASIGVLVLALPWAIGEGERLFTYPQQVATSALGTGPSAPDFSLHYRQNVYAWALRIFLDHPLLGTGVGTFPLMLGRYQQIPYISGLYAHNHYLQTASEMGLVGLLILLALLGGLFWKGVKIVRNLPSSSSERSLAVALFSALLASSLHAGIDFDWSYPAIALGVVLEAALLLSYSRPLPSDFLPLAHGPKIKALAASLIVGIALLAFARHYAEVSLRWGKWALQERLLGEAEVAFRRVPRFYPFSYASHYWLSIVLAERGSMKEAVREAEAALRFNPKDGDAHYDIGKMYWRMGRLDEAEQALSAAVRMEPSSRLRFYADLGEILLARGRAEEAFRVYRKAMEVFRPEMVLSSNGRCLAPGDRYLLVSVVERLSETPEWKGKSLAEKLREPDLRGICRDGLKAGFTSPEATVLTHWKAAKEGRSDLLLATLTRELRRTLNSRSVNLPAWTRDLSFSRIVELSGGETEAWVVYEVTLRERRLRLRDRLKLEGDGWRLVQLRGNIFRHDIDKFQQEQPFRGLEWQWKHGPKYL